MGKLYYRGPEILEVRMCKFPLLKIMMQRSFKQGIAKACIAGYTAYWLF